MVYIYKHTHTHINLHVYIHTHAKRERNKERGFVRVYIFYTNMGHLRILVIGGPAN